VFKRSKFNQSEVPPIIYDDVLTGSGGWTGSVGFLIPLVDHEEFYVIVGY
jgi:hypothetical protein